jgi:hypothetical protein
MALPGLGYDAETVTQASTASTYHRSGGPGVDQDLGGDAPRLGLPADQVSLAVTLTRVWGQLVSAPRLRALRCGGTALRCNDRAVGLVAFVVVAGALRSHWQARARRGRPGRPC